MASQQWQMLNLLSSRVVCIGPCTGVCHLRPVRHAKGKELRIPCSCPTVMHQSVLLRMSTTILNKSAIPVQGSVETPVHFFEGVLLQVVELFPNPGVVARAAWTHTRSCCCLMRVCYIKCKACSRSSWNSVQSRAVVYGLTRKNDTNKVRGLEVGVKFMCHRFLAYCI